MKNWKGQDERRKKGKTQEAATPIEDHFPLMIEMHEIGMCCMKNGTKGRVSSITSHSLLARLEALPWTHVYLLRRHPTPTEDASSLPLHWLCTVFVLQEELHATLQRRHMI